MDGAVCWCGSPDLTPFGPDYLECRSCGALVRLVRPDSDMTRVSDEDRDFYGRNYWFKHQTELRLPTIEGRRVTDLRDRHPNWLRTVLAYKRPPARVLEIGAAHGGFVALLAAAGFDAIGLEPSRWVADYAARTSGARMLVGPLEDQQLEAGSFDLILAFDVLEHLPDPVGTLGRCVQLLKDDALVMLQTPRRVPLVGYPSVMQTHFRYLLVPEHLYLFTEAAASRLLQRVGLSGIAMEPPAFESDMVLVAGRHRPVRLTPTDSRDPCPASGSMRLAESLVTLDDLVRQERAELNRRVEELEARYHEADRDRIERLQRNGELDVLLAQADRDRTERQAQIEVLESRYRDADRDRSERLRMIGEVEALFQQADRDRTERQAQIEVLETRYRDADRDRSERLRMIGEIEALFQQADRDRSARLARIQELESAIAQADRDLGEVRCRAEALEARCRRADEDLAERLRTIADLETRYHQINEDQAARLSQLDELAARWREAGIERTEQLIRITELEAEKAALAVRFETLRALAADHRNSRLYRMMVRYGRWRVFDARLRPIVEQPRSADAGTSVCEHLWVPRTTTVPADQGAIAIDLTAILPGGENGGAKLVAMELVRGLSRRAPGRQFLLVTSPSSHHEVSPLEAANVRRRLVNPGPAALAELLGEERISVLFCPMTSAPFDDPRVPVVCLIHDLQHVTYPAFFGDADLDGRRQALERAVRVADHVVTPSEYVRRTVLEHSTLTDDQVSAIPHRFSAHRLPRPPESRVAETIERYGLDRGRYFVYPANFWRHKNHLMLLMAFAQLCQRRPDLDLRLVLTGASRPDPGTVRDSVRRMRLADRVLLPGYVPAADLAALLAGAVALVLPSLYEGFGMPILEAFSAGCPVACSSVTSLPEVAGEAALYFDPRNPEAVSKALERLATSPELRESLRAKGEIRCRQMAGAEQTAAEYFAIIDRIASLPRRQRTRLGGVFTDRWTTSSLVLSYAGGDAETRLELENPRPVAVTLAADGVAPISVEPGGSLAIRCILPPAARSLEIAVGPTFRPSDDGTSTDTRLLGVRLRACEMRRQDGTALDLLAGIASV